MPYIAQERREALRREIATNAGELNFAISTLVNCYLNTKGVRYDTLNEAIGVLECAKLELYRRIAAPYEDKKLTQNGDVYG